MTSPTRGGLAPGPSADPGLDSEPGRGVRQSILRLRFTAIAAGAPTATPVADRLHLVHNLRHVLERVFRWHGVGPAPVPPLGEPDPPRGPAASAPLPRRVSCRGMPLAEGQPSLYPVPGDPGAPLGVYLGPPVSHRAARAVSEALTARLQPPSRVGFRNLGTLSPTSAGIW